MTAWKRWQDWATVLLGVVVFVTPFVFGVAIDSPAARTAFVIGALLALGGLWNEAMPKPNAAVEWIPLILGVVLFVAPWIMGFTDLQTMAWAAWVIGIVAVLNSGAELFLPAQGSTAA